MRAEFGDGSSHCQFIAPTGYVRMLDSIAPEANQAMEEADMTTHRRSRRLWTKTMIFIRRVHLYAGLLMLPWVLLYGITGAMFNHQELFPHVGIQTVPASVLAETPMKDFPSPEEFAQQIVTALQAASGERDIDLSERPRAEYSNDVMFEVFADGDRHVVQIDPVGRDAKVVSFPENAEVPEPVFKDLNHIRLKPNPHDAAQQSARAVLKEAGIAGGTPTPFAWSKLNFLANVKGEPVRVTYVLKDGHVDVTKYQGEDGMNPREFFLRLHTSHGQSPHWNQRSVWSLFVDTMAISMVAWGLSGLLMWWQIKRTRVIGGILMLLSIATATFMYLGMHDFYATTKL